MKNLISILIVAFFLVFINFKSHSQSAGCTPPSSAYYLDINNVRALIMENHHYLQVQYGLEDSTKTDNCVLQDKNLDKMEMISGQDH